MNQLPALTWEQLRAIHDHFAKAAVAQFNDEGELLPQVFLVAHPMQFPPSAAASVPAAHLAALFRAGTGQDTLELFLRGALTRGSTLHAALSVAVGFELTAVVQVNEAWVTPVVGPEDSSGRTRLRRTPPEEAILVVVHTTSVSVPVMHPVDQAAGRKATVAVFPPEAVRWPGPRRGVLH